MDTFLQPDAWISLLTLTFLEVVLGVDNIIFISIVSEKLPEAQRPKARNLGLLLALGFRVLLLMGITWIIGFTAPLFTLFDHAFSGKDLILAAGGLFLLAKSTSEIHHKMEGKAAEGTSGKGRGLLSIVLQIVLLDIVFSFDSILTAVGLTHDLKIMVIAVIISMIIMMIFAGRIARFINQHPTVQMLALSFLILIGFMLVAEALHEEIPKGYIYFAVAFSLVVEMLNMRLRKKSTAAPSGAED
ncbi:MAG: TerC family protein [Bacteroidota bacterium]